VELGLGLPSAAPTALELAAKEADAAAAAASGTTPEERQRLNRLAQLNRLHAAAMPEGETALKAALFGSFADRLPREQQVAVAAVMVRTAPSLLPQCRVLIDDAGPVKRSTSVPCADGCASVKGLVRESPACRSPMQAAAAGVQELAPTPGAVAPTNTPMPSPVTSTGAVPDSRLEQEFLAAASRHRASATAGDSSSQGHDGTPGNPPAAVGGPAGGSTPAVAPDWHAQQEAAVDAPSTKRLPDSRRLGGEWHSPAVVAQVGCLCD
jgi:hypothetical protein